MTISDRVLDVLVGVSEIEDVRHEPDVRLYDLQILDSMKTVELIVAFSSEFGVEISPAEFDREEWATPRKIISYMERKIAPEGDVQVWGFVRLCGTQADSRMRSASGSCWQRPRARELSRPARSSRRTAFIYYGFQNRQPSTPAHRVDFRNLRKYAEVDGRYPPGNCDCV